MLYAMGGVQIVGSALLTAGFLTRSPGLVRDRGPQLLPVVTADRVGLVMVGAF